MSDGERRSIVQVVDDSLTDGSSCSGTFVAPHWVLTAAHCSSIVPATVQVLTKDGAPAARIPVVQKVLHPTADVALLQLDLDKLGSDSIPASEALGLSMLLVGDSSVASFPVGSAVEVAGYGLTESGTVGALRFLVETVEASDSDEITLSGFGQQGACAGDSGGPLLTRAGDGHVAVVGVLSRGSPSCLRSDSYARVDSEDIRGWISALTNGYLPGVAECGKLTAEGRCFSNSAQWCEAGNLIARDCMVPTGCGWDVAANGFRCVDSSSPCRGADAVGHCENNVAFSCVAGHRVTDSCGKCATCRVTGATGQPYCDGDMQ